MIPQALNIYRDAEAGLPVNAQQRRHCIGYLMAMEPEKAADTAGLAELFKVSDTLIRKDKRTIREEKAAIIKDEDIGLVLADIHITYENVLRGLQKSLNATKEGTVLYVKTLAEIRDTVIKITDSLQSLGYYPKNLGTQTTKKYNFYAVSDQKDGSVEVHNEAVTPRTIDAEFVDPYEKERAALDEEFGDRPAQCALPPAPIKTDATRTDSTLAGGDSKCVIDAQTGASFSQP